MYWLKLNSYLYENFFAFDQKALQKYSQTLLDEIYWKSRFFLKELIIKTFNVKANEKGCLFIVSVISVIACVMDEITPKHTKIKHTMNT